MSREGNNLRVNFKIGHFAHNLLSTGRMFDAGCDIVYSHSDGCYLGWITPNGTYVKVPMVMKRNIFGVPANVHRDMEDAKSEINTVK